TTISERRADWPSLRLTAPSSTSRLAERAGAPSAIRAVPTTSPKLERRAARRLRSASAPITTLRSVASAVAERSVRQRRNGHVRGAMARTRLPSLLEVHAPALAMAHENLERPLL